MDNSSGAKNLPAGFPQKAASLKKNLDSIERLVLNPIRMAEFGINLIETHEIQIIGGRKEEQAARTRDAVELLDAFQRFRQVFDSFAGNNNVEKPIGKRQSMRVALRERCRCSGVLRLPAFFAD